MPALVRRAAAHVERRVQTAQGRTGGVQRDLGGGSPRCAREYARCAHFLTENIARTFFSRLSFRWSAKIYPIRAQSVIPCEIRKVGQSRERVQLALRPRSARFRSVCGSVTATAHESLSGVHGRRWRQTATIARTFTFLRRAIVRDSGRNNRRRRLTPEPRTFIIVRSFNALYASTQMPSPWRARPDPNRLPHR